MSVFMDCKTIQEGINDLFQLRNARRNDKQTKDR